MYEDPVQLPCCLNYRPNYMLLFQKAAPHSVVFNSEEKQDHCLYEDYSFGMLQKVVLIC